MDGEFKRIKLLMPTVECKTTTAKEHIIKAEQTIQALKEGLHGSIMTWPFKHIPKQMKIEFMYFIVLWLRAFLLRMGISLTYSLCKLLVQ